MTAVARAELSLAVVLCALILVSMLPALVAAEEYLVFTFDEVFIDSTVGGAVDECDFLFFTGPCPDSLRAASTLLGQFKAAVAGAYQANSEGDVSGLLSGLGKVIGITEALIAVFSRCETRACADARNALQHTTGLAAQAKATLLGIARSCHPNGVVQPNEQCDPLAVPTGCPTNTVALLFCNDQCRCQGVGP
jgi:hypothetical protein